MNNLSFADYIRANHGQTVSIVSDHGDHFMAVIDADAYDLGQGLPACLIEKEADRV